MLTEELGKTTRLCRTRQKVGRVGAVQTLTDFVLSKKPARGFEMLMEREMPDLSGEAIVLRHAGHFPLEVVAASEARLAKAGEELRTSQTRPCAPRCSPHTRG